MRCLAAGRSANDIAAIAALLALPDRRGEGLVGTAVSEKLPVLANELTSDSRYVPIAPGMQSELVVPLILKGRAIGALNILSGKPHAFSEADVALLYQFGAHVAAALENARLFERERRDAEVFEILAEIGREVSAILDLDELLTHLVALAKRLIDYRTFGILLLNEDAGELEMKVGLQYGGRVQLPRVKIGDGLVGYAALHKVPVVVPDVSKDPRYIKVVEDVRSEMAAGGADDDTPTPKTAKGKKARPRQPSDTLELFNLADDPAEKRNLAAEKPEKLQELRARYEALAAQAVPPKNKPMSPDFKALSKKLPSTHRSIYKGAAECTNA